MLRINLIHRNLGFFLAAFRLFLVHLLRFYFLIIYKNCVKIFKTNIIYNKNLHNIYNIYIYILFVKVLLNCDNKTRWYNVLRLETLIATYFVVILSIYLTHQEIIVLYTHLKIRDTMKCLWFAGQLAKSRLKLSEKPRYWHSTQSVLCRKPSWASAFAALVLWHLHTCVPLTNICLLLYYVFVSGCIRLHNNNRTPHHTLHMRVIPVHSAIPRDVLLRAEQNLVNANVGPIKKCVSERMMSAYT